MFRENSNWYPIVYKDLLLIARLTYSDTKLQMLNAMAMQARWIHKFSETIVSEVIQIGILVTILPFQNMINILIYYSRNAEKPLPNDSPLGKLLPKKWQNFPFPTEKFPPGKSPLQDLSSKIEKIKQVKSDL